jgi:hypothetical protein
MKIMIVSSARTGSNYLTKLLFHYSLKNTVLINEPFPHAITFIKNQDDFVSKIFKKIKKPDKKIILKTHLNQIYNIKNKKYINYFLNNNNWFKILLLRKDLFSCTLSHAVAANLNNFNNKEYKTYKVIKISESQFLSILNNKLTYWNKFAELKASGNYNQIIYFEDLSFKPAEDIKKINLPFVNNTSKKFKHITKTPQEQIIVLNKKKLQKIFFKFINEFSFVGVKNNNGFLELE